MLDPVLVARDLDPDALVPADRRAGTVLTLGDDPLELSILQRCGSTCMASRLSAGSGEGPFGTAQDSRTPSISSRRSQWSELA